MISLCHAAGHATGRFGPSFGATSDSGSPDHWHPYCTGLQQSSASDIPPASDALRRLLRPKQQKLIRQVSSASSSFNFGVHRSALSSAAQGAIHHAFAARPLARVPPCPCPCPLSDPCPCVVSFLPLSSANSWTLDSAIRRFSPALALYCRIGWVGALSVYTRFGYNFVYDGVLVIR
jgi:hypothetical protein